jgi:hypothetical protein
VGDAEGGTPVITATQGVRLTSECGHCGGELVRDVGQFVDRGRLRWGVEGRCRDCTSAWCELGTGPAPREIRQALLAQHGTARLCLADQEASLVPALRALREMRQLSLREARRMATELKERGLVGTFVEMAHLAEGLRGRSVSVTITSHAVAGFAQPAPAPTPAPARNPGAPGKHAGLPSAS